MAKKKPTLTKEEAMKEALKKIGADNPFNRWVLAMGGRRKIAIAFDVSDWTASNWCKGLYNPDVPTIIKMLNVAREMKHPLTFDDIYKGTTSNKVDSLKLH